MNKRIKRWRFQSMADSTRQRDPVDPIGLDFNVLRADGIAMLQRLCGELWTDYNLHDPGVTTLEQLVYGLTDLAYRTEFDMADYLTGANGEINYQQLALYAPEAVLSGAALTLNDYRRLIYDALPELSDIWIRPSRNGLFVIDVMLDPALLAVGERHANKQALMLEKKVSMVYAANRTLCENLYRVSLVQPRLYYLKGEIDTCGERSQADILAQILFDCNNFISSGIAVQRLRDVMDQDLVPEQVFDGPTTRHGYVTTSDAASLKKSVRISELIGLIQKIEGVSQIRNLTFVNAKMHQRAELRCDTRYGGYPCLPFPSGDEQIALLRLIPMQGIEHGVSEQTMSSALAAWAVTNRDMHADAALELKKLQFQRNAFRTEERLNASIFPLPAGRYRDLRDYYSIQNEFPAVYGINQFGLPYSASPERKAQAAQLKAFLFPFEQLMANYLQTLQELPTLFSTDLSGPAGDAGRSYFTQYLGNSAIPKITALYMDDGKQPEAVQHALNTALAKQDNYIERKGRLYDYLLAIYGETFSQVALRRFNHYHLSDTEQWLLEAKARLVRELVALSAERGRAFNYLRKKDKATNFAQLQRRVEILLGFDERTNLLAFSAAGDDYAIILVDDSDSKTGSGVTALKPDSTAVPSMPAGDPRPQLPADFGELGKNFPQSLFRNGTMLSNFRLVTEGSVTAVYGRTDHDWLHLTSNPDRLQAVRAAYAYMDTLIALNQRDEHMHLVEHILLRPFGHDEQTRQLACTDANFYAARMSVVLPNWTVRCANRDFRNFFEDTLRQHCPAHIYPIFYWLTPAQMAQFEELQTEWHKALRSFHLSIDMGQNAQGQQGGSHISAAIALTVFLRAHTTDRT